MKKRNIQIGARLFLASLCILLGIHAGQPLAGMILGALCMKFPVKWGRHSTGILAEGTPDELEAVLKEVKKQTEEMLTKKAFLGKEAVDLVVKEAMKAFNELPVEQLKELLSDGEKGIKTILKAQGTAIGELQEMIKKSEAHKLTFKKLLTEKMDEIEKIHKNKSGIFELSLKSNEVLKAAAVMTTDNTITGHDSLPDDLIESFSEAKFVAKRRPREYVYDLANVTTVSEIEQFKTWLEEGDEQGAFAVVAEGGLKPLVSTSLVRNFSEYRKVAGKYVVTEEFTKFRTRAYNIIRRLIEQKMLRDKAAILTTSLLADAAPYTASALDNQFPFPTDWHAIAAVASQIEALDFSPDLIILNPQDKWRIGMSQDQEGRFYMQVPGMDPTAEPRILGFNIRTSNRVPVGYFLLGESGLWEIEQEGITVRIGYGVTVTGGASNGGGSVTDVQSDLDHNRFRVIVENYFHNWIATNNTGSFVYANFAAVKAAVEGDPGS
jgi:hypothetical protein